jgi:2-beta-glucuronyltransferase
MQYAAAGLNAVCPSFAAGDKESRFAYKPNDEGSIVEAIQLALDRPPARPPQFFSWEEVTDRLLSPQSYLETRTLSRDQPSRDRA